MRPRFIVGMSSESRREREARTRLHLLLAALLAQLRQLPLAVLAPGCEVLGILLYLACQQHLGQKLS